MTSMVPKECLPLVIKPLIMVIFVGYIMIWCMMPTKAFWLHWLPTIHQKTNSTFFGEQGANILLYTFPILLIATLSCIYLHMGKKNADRNAISAKGYPRLASWKKPVLVRGPLGIVSWIELSFLSMFIALLLWSFSAYLHGMFANITRQSAVLAREKVWEDKLGSAALMMGLVGNICLAFLFFPVSRGSSVLRLVRLTSEASIKYHTWLGHMVMALFTAHGICYIIFWAKTGQISQMLKWEKSEISNVAGEVALVCGLAMWATSFAPIRRKLFEVFFYSHHLYTLFILFFMFHVGFSYSCIMLPGYYLFMVDRYLRFLQSQQRVRLISARLLPCQAVQLNFSKSPGLKYNAASIIFVNVPSVSKLQWHPFSVTSSSDLEPEMLSVVIKCQGSWSHKLYQKLASPSSSPLDCLDVSIEGPYGPASTHFMRHDTIVMVSGGSGITPFISIIGELLSKSSSPSFNPPKVLLISVFKKSADLTMLDLLPVSSIASNISSLQIQIEAYITRGKETIKDDQKIVQTIWFKPSPSTSPIFAALGPNNWLWLATIISSSFLIFLLLIGLITRYYIYPTERNDNVIYSYSLRAGLNMLFMCISIAMTSTTVFLWNRRQNTIQMKQIQNTETSAGSPFYNVDRELESLPHQSFLQATKVHYGSRPDLKKMLLECEGSCVRVLVSGPKNMRQEVATICSSGLRQHLHFESFSFSW